MRPQGCDSEFCALRIYVSTGARDRGRIQSINGAINWLSRGIEPFNARLALRRRANMIVRPMSAWSQRRSCRARCLFFWTFLVFMTIKTLSRYWIFLKLAPAMPMALCKLNCLCKSFINMDIYVTTRWVLEEKTSHNVSKIVKMSLSNVQHW